MSFDLFIGRPRSRIIRSKDLLNYYNSETDWDTHGEMRDETILPSIGQFALDLAEEWPALNAAGPLVEATRNGDDSHAASYSFGPTSVYLCFGWSRQSEAHRKVRALAVRHDLLFFNCSGSDWINATRAEQGRAGMIFLAQPRELGRTAQWDGVATWIEPGDIELLTAGDCFTPNSHFGYEFEEQHYMQVYNSGSHYQIEYREGSRDCHYRATTTSLEKIKESFKLYHEGSDLAFRLLDYKKIQV